MKQFLGKYRGTVIDNLDPLQIGRLLVQVPDVSNVLPSTWAMPCVPVAGIQSGCFAVPPVGSGVWIEFEQGNSDYPIWTGCFWGSAAEVPVPALAAQVADPPPGGGTIVFQTTLQSLLMVSDAPPVPMLAPIPAPAPPGTGGIVLRSPTGAMIVVNDEGIFINNGKGATVELVANTVMINKVALVVV